MLVDKAFDIPDGRRYEVVRERAEHSIINYALGLVFSEFAGLFSNIDMLMAKRGIKMVQMKHGLR